MVLTKLPVLLRGLSRPTMSFLTQTVWRTSTQLVLRPILLACRKQPRFDKFKPWQDGRSDVLEGLKGSPSHGDIILPARRHRLASAPRTTASRKLGAGKTASFI